MPGKKKAEKYKGIKRKPAALMAEIFMLTAVIAAALLAPQLIFLVQDRFLFGRTELSRQDSADTVFLGSTYEQSLHQRMLNFSEGLAAGERFYVAVRNLVENEELKEYLYSNRGLYQELMYVFEELDLIYTPLWNDDVSVGQWKQYVIYSDNYAKGVNFILWYIELFSGSGMVMKLLTDGETGMIYAVKTESSRGLALKDTDMGGQRSPRYWRLFQEDGFCEEFLVYLMMYYETQNWEELSAIRDGTYYDESENRLDGMTRMLELAKSGEYVRKDRTFLFQLPYGEKFLDFSLAIGDVNIIENEKLSLQGIDFVFMYPDFMLGIQEIYEMIPEFQQ